MEKINKDASVKELLDLLQVARLVVSTLNLDQVLEAILKSAMKLTKTSAGSIALYNKSKQELEMHAHKGFSKDFVGNTRWKVRPDGLTDTILNSDKPTVITDVTKKEFFTNPVAISEGIKSVICVPLVSKDEIIGILYVDDFTPRRFGKNDLELLSILSSFAAMSIDHARLHARTSKMAATDGLTGLFNHRYMKQQLGREFCRAARYKETFSVMMLDIDNFKKINDLHGHTFGDKVLQKLAEILKSSVRESDTAARYGGEEFAIILPKVESDQALVLANRIRKHIKDKSAPLMKGKGNLTVSIGISSYPKDSQKKMDLLKQADKALYEAKRRGKDQAVEHREL
ncbi:MAG: sensor domain-containing diguanylate cyclase [Nitrospirota bacterium]